LGGLPEQGEDPGKLEPVADRKGTTEKKKKKMCDTEGRHTTKKKEKRERSAKRDGARGPKRGGLKQSCLEDGDALPGEGEGKRSLRKGGREKLKGKAPRPWTHEKKKGEGKSPENGTTNPKRESKGVCPRFRRKRSPEKKQPAVEEQNPSWETCPQ